MLKWCRTNMRLTTAEVAMAMQRDESDIIAWEDGSESPTFAQLRRLGQIYKRPVAVFYLPENPRDFTLLKDFRRLRGGESQEFSPALSYLIRTCRERQEWIAEYARQEGEEELPFVNSASINDDAAVAGQSLRDMLGAKIANQRNLSSVDAGFRYWRDLCESIGVYVFVATRANVSTDEMRGFALPDTIAPVVVVNGAERSYAARTFTLLHEMAHVLIGIGGVSDLSVSSQPRTEDQRTEVFCNAVAAEALVPRDDFRQRALIYASNPDSALSPLATFYRVSEQVIARRLFDLQIADRLFYDRKIAEFSAREVSDVDESNEEFRIPMETRVMNSVGRRFSRAAISAFHSGSISGPTLSDLLNMRLQHLHNLEQKLVTKAAV
jgi:Zn-dependent peptidase ImmA (M78 family)